MAAAFDALPQAEQRRLEGLSALHSIVHSQTKAGVSFGEHEGSARAVHAGSLLRRPLVKEFIG